jgi:nucleoside-diphosphate-sugar epimerase
LRAAGHEVIALVREPERAGALAAMGIRLSQGDVTDQESMRAPMLGVDGVFHIAGWYKVGARVKAPAAAVNIKGTRNVLELMSELRIPKGVYTSTLAVNSDTQGRLVDESYHFSGTHLSEYDRTKAAAHQIALDFIGRGLPLVIVMPGLVYGLGDPSLVGQSLRLFLQRKLPAAPRQTAYCWSHVEDTARAHILAMERGTPGETYIIAGPPHSMVEALQVAHEISGAPVPPALPPSVFKAMAAAARLVEKILPLPELYSSEAQRVIAGVTYQGDNRKARQELGYEPRTLREGFQEWLPQEQQALSSKL